MGVPTHGLDCQTRTFPTYCKKCGDKVFYFSCSCGSKAFFDDLGWPWLEHCCEFSKSDWEWATSRPRKKDGAGGVRVQLSSGVTATRPPDSPDEGWKIDPSVAVEAKRRERSRRENPIEAVPPGAERRVEITGVVTELTSQVDVYRSLRISPTAINKGFLGVLGSGEWGRVTVHVLEDVIYSYTAWVPAVLLKGDVRRGVAVSALLHRLDVAGKAREWVCTQFQVE